MRQIGTAKSPKRTAIQKRQAAAAEAREKYPKLFEHVNELREKAKEAFAPRYTSQQLGADMVELAKKWRRSNKLDTRLDQIEKLFGLASRQRANKYAVLVNAICPNGLDRRVRSKLAKRVEKSLSYLPTQRLGRREEPHDEEW